MISYCESNILNTLVDLKMKLINEELEFIEILNQLRCIQSSQKEEAVRGRLALLDDSIRPERLSPKNIKEEIVFAESYEKVKKGLENIYKNITGALFPVIEYSAFGSISYERHREVLEMVDVLKNVLKVLHIKLDEGIIGIRDIL